ncbi:MAG: M48 family metallopeptidase [Deltaproteobacteria bacterium]|nr:M48 family metallopeptidase [Deltaproteobacteria bacterium]
MLPSSSKLLASRFLPDLELLERLKAEPQLAAKLTAQAGGAGRNWIRAQLLSTAVRVEPRLMPAIARCLEEVRQRAGLGDPLEAYVHEEAAINAFVTKGRTHTLVVLSSAAVNTLEEDELQFVIGHELGHAVFGHLDVGAGRLVESNELEQRQSMQIRAWQRASEISADRCGLVCCGSLDTAASALYKTLSGLRLPGAKIDPAVFAEQWDFLSSELIDGGGLEDWDFSHPFPPLRMRALKLFWESPRYRELGEAPGAPPSEQRRGLDGQVSTLLALMDPLARKTPGAADPLLVDFHLWGGLYVALADGTLSPAEVEQLVKLTSLEKVQGALGTLQLQAEACLGRFRECLGRRHRKLSSMETHRILEALFLVAHAENRIDERELVAVKAVAKELKVSPEACDLLMSNFLKGR